MFPEKTLKKSRWDVIFALLLAAAIALSLWKCPYGYITDDGFYLTVPHRLSMGDVLFADEWHVSQMAGLLTMPLVWLYRTLTGSTDGILLAARYAYVVCHALVSAVFYLRVRRYGAAGAAAALSWFLFTPYSIMALSYNTMGMDLILLSGLFLATSEKAWCWALSGMFLAGAVLCSPYFAAAWFLYAIGAGICILWRRQKAGHTSEKSILAPSRLLWLTTGTAACAALFLLYVLYTCGIRGIWANLPYILADPEHAGVSFVEKLRHGLNILIHCHPLFPLVLLGFLALLLLMLLDMERKKRRGAYLIAACALTVSSYALFWSDLMGQYYNAVMLPMVFVGLTAFLLCRERPWGLFVTLFLGGIVYAVAVTLGSNNYFYAIAMASAVTNAASLLFLGQLLAEMREEWNSPSAVPILSRAALGAAALSAAVLLVTQVYVKANHCFGDDPPSQLTIQLQGGPGDGLWTTDYKAGVYQRLYGELLAYKNLPQGKLLILNERSWCCLAADPMEYSCFSAWMGREGQSMLDRLEDYYRMNPGKIPDHIFLSKNSLFDDPQAILKTAQSRGYALTESEFSYYLSRK